MQQFLLIIMFCSLFSCQGQKDQKDQKEFEVIKISNNDEEAPCNACRLLVCGGTVKDLIESEHIRYEVISDIPGERIFGIACKACDGMFEVKRAYMKTMSFNCAKCAAQMKKSSTNTTGYIGVYKGSRRTKDAPYDRWYTQLVNNGKTYTIAMYKFEEFPDDDQGKLLCALDRDRFIRERGFKNKKNFSEEEFYSLIKTTYGYRLDNTIIGISDRN